ncbi:EAL domain-containing protein [Acaryochloris sp. IP29b_bin.148]|uniref:GGDEF/EAL domain-containing response regulator n=1 Tax=Acaryochloris sp. IP29b_bin.148 TaxID=2969218 RepID=UPI00260F3595|nr:EAL domain-containing protein [Acaryochloris sp. IP29b_bin.148]
MSKGTIICIDDDRLILSSLRYQLQRIIKSTYEIEVAESGGEALELFSELEADQISIPLVICDQNLPDMGGDSLLSYLQIQYPKTRKILLTGDANLEAVIHAINAANLYRYIAKPWDETDLGLTVKAALQSYLQDEQLLDQNRTLRAVNAQLHAQMNERQSMQQKLQDSEQRLESILNSLDDVVWSAAVDGFQLLYLNPAAEKVHGYAVTSFLNNPDLWSEVVHPADRHQVLHFFEHLLAAGHLSIEYRILRPDGEIRWLKNRGHVITDVQEIPIRLDGIIYDITEQKRAQAQLLYDAFHDELTGLPNRNLLMERISQSLKRQCRVPNYQFALLFIDLDRFKIINDSLGHTVGDQLLVAIANLLEHCVRSADTVARLGGDEFTILLDGTQGIEDATQVAERILETLTSPFQVGDHSVFTGASIGITSSHEQYTDATLLLRDADIAMYRAKALGKGCFVIFSPEMHAQTLSLLQLERDLRSAVDRQELVLYYQPIIALKAGQLTDVEVLVRWQHPERGLVMPSEFIPIAEDTGLIIEIGKWVLQEACIQLRYLQQQFPSASTLRVSVNLASEQLQEPNFIHDVDQILTQSGLDGSYLKLELTESMLMAHEEKHITTLRQLRDRKIQISLDDFGTGYSSLSYLYRFPLDTLKIDRSFVSRMMANPKDTEIVNTIISLARTLNMNVIAEGIETEAEATHLIHLGCEYGQGYLFSPPVNRQQLEEYLTANQQWFEPPQAPDASPLSTPPPITRSMP